MQEWVARGSPRPRDAGVLGDAATWEEIAERLGRSRKAVQKQREPALIG